MHSSISRNGFYQRTRVLYTNHENILVKMLHSLDSIHISQQQQSNEVSSAQNSQHNNQEQIPPSIKKRYASDFTFDTEVFS